MKRKIFSIVFALALVLGFVLATAAPAGANGGPNPTFATVSMPGMTTPSANINIGWERATVYHLGTDAIHVTTSTATIDYAEVIVPTNFILVTGTTISYWGYTVAGDVKAPDEIYLFLDMDSNGTFDIGAGDIILTSHKPGPVASEWYGQWHEWTLTDPANEWHIVPEYTEVPLAAYIDHGYTVLAIALTAGPSTTSGPVNVNVYFDELIVNGSVVLNDDTGIIDVPVPFAGLPPACIQDAVDAALPGDTVNVAAGTYAGAIVDKDVTISGAAGGTSIITSGVPYKVGGAYTTAFRLDSGADGTQINNFTINNNEDASFYFAVFARGADNVTVDSLAVNDTVQGINNWGGSGWTITNNAITDTVAAGGGGIGIFLGALPPDYRTCSNNLVQDNTINATATAADYSCPGILLSLDLRYGAYDLLNGTEDISGNQILSNDITASGVNNGVGIEVGTILGNSEEDPARNDPVKIAAIMAAAAVHDNTVQENTVNGADEGIYFYNVTDLTVTQNGIENSVGDGIFAEHAQSGTVIQNNDFSSNNIQLTDDTGTLDIATILANNTFDRAVTVDHEGASLLPTIWSRIQDGIDAAVGGDTVYVAAGTYKVADESWQGDHGCIYINKDITLRGAGSDLTILDAEHKYSVLHEPGDFQQHCTVVWNEAQNVTIAGLTVANGDYGIRNSTIWFGGGVPQNSATFTDVVVTNNYGIGIVFENDITTATFTDCKANYSGDFGIYFNPTHAAGTVSLTNTSANSNGHIGFSCQGSIADLSISGGTFNNNTGGIFHLDYSHDVGPYYGFGIELQNCVGTLTDVTAQGNGGDGPAEGGAGINVKGASSDVTISNSTLAGNPIGLWLENWDGLQPAPAAVAIHYSNIAGNDDYGVKNDCTGMTVDATDNWWGSANGPTHAGNTFNVGSQGDAVSDNVDYCPWYDTDMTGASFAPVTTTAPVDSFASIQAGVNAASPGSTVNVAAGTYTEAVTINKPLTLRGATYNVNKNGYAVPADYAWDETAESIIIHPNPTVAYNAIVDIVDVDNVTFEGFIVQELNAVGNNNTSLIRVYAHTREISNIVVRNNVIGPNTNATSQDGTHGRMGLYLVNHPYSDQYGIVNSTFSGNKIFDCKGNGNNVFIWSSYSNPSYGAPGPASMAGTVVDDNEIYGAHRSGIETAGGYTGLTIQNNKIYNNGGMFEADADNLKYGHGIILIRGSGDSHSDTVPGLGPEDLTIKDNEIYGNQKSGIYMGPISKNYTITGNKIYNNGWDGMRLDLAESYNNPDFEEGDRIPWADQTENISAHFNNIYSNGMLGIRVIGEPTNGFIFDAENNWWGDASGPYHDPTNTEGLGDAVSDNVDYEPWVGASVEDTKTEDITDGTLDAIDEADTEVIVTGNATVTVAEYTDNPGGGFGGDTGKYIDVNIDDATGVTEIEIRLYYTNADIAGLVESSLTLRWWNGATWVECSDSGVNTTDIPGPPAYSGYMWAKIRNGPPPTTPSLDDLTGTAFGGGGSGGGGGGGGGGGAGTILPSVTGLVVIPPLELDPDGIIQATCHLKTTDGKLTLDITKGTKLLDPAAKPLKILSAVREILPPSAPSGAVIIIAYNFGLNGATFSPPITLTINYDPATLPEDVAEEDLYIAYWDGSKWVALETTVDTMARAASCSISHYTTFALIGSVTPPAPAAFSVSSLSIQPAEVQPNDVVNITLSVANTGETEGSYSVVLKINGAKEAEKSITLAPGDSESAGFSVNKAEAGSYSVDVNGLSGSFTVVGPAALEEAPPEAAAPIAWWIWVIAGVVVVGLIIFFVARRRAY